MASSSSSTDTSKLPLKPIPDSYGLPFFGPIRNSREFFYRQGRDAFFFSRMKLYNSTIFRTNMPTDSFISSDARVVAVLDAVSFPVHFDVSRVSKQDVLDGTFMPSTAFTGNYRVYAFLDTTEPSHALEASSSTSSPRATTLSSRSFAPPSPSSSPISTTKSQSIAKPASTPSATK